MDNKEYIGQLKLLATMTKDPVMRALLDLLVRHVSLNKDSVLGFTVNRGKK